VAHDVFISYSHHDKPRADSVCATLEAKGIRCWIAPRDVIPGQEWGEALVDAIRSSRVMVLVFSSHANESPQIRREVQLAVSTETVLIPFRIEDVAPARSLEYFLGAPHWLDAMTPPLEAHLERLAVAVASFLGVSRQTGAGAGDGRASPIGSLGGTRRVVQSTVDEVLATDPGQRTQQLQLLRAAFIPWLATINPDNNQPMCRFARESDLPEESRPLIDALVEKRLMVRYERDGQLVIEVASESLLREWDDLAGWLREERQNLTTKGIDRITKQMLQSDSVDQPGAESAARGHASTASAAPSFRVVGDDLAQIGVAPLDASDVPSTALPEADRQTLSELAAHPNVEEIVRRVDLLFEWADRKFASSGAADRINEPPGATPPRETDQRELYKALQLAARGLGWLQEASQLLPNARPQLREALARAGRLFYRIGWLTYAGGYRTLGISRAFEDFADLMENRHEETENMLESDSADQVGGESPSK
jgi:hypothetical protein